MNNVNFGQEEVNYDEYIIDPSLDFTHVECFVGLLVIEDS